MTNTTYHVGQRVEIVDDILSRVIGTGSLIGQAATIVPPTPKQHPENVRVLIDAAPGDVDHDAVYFDVVEVRPRTLTAEDQAGLEAAHLAEYRAAVDVVVWAQRSDVGADDGFVAQAGRRVGVYLSALEKTRTKIAAGIEFQAAGTSVIGHEAARTFVAQAQAAGMPR